MSQELLERIVVVEQKSAAAHERLDKAEASTQRDIKEINQDLKGILQWMHNRDGAEKERDRLLAKVASIAALAGAFLGALLQYIPLLFKK